MFKTTLSVAFATALAGIAVTSAASAAVPTGPYAIFKYCPYNNPQVGACVVNTTTSGTLAMGTTTLPITHPIVLQGGVIDTGPSPLYDAVGAATLSAPPAKVPGGLLGITNPLPEWPLPLWVAFWNIVGTVNDVTATMEPVDTIQTNFGNALFPPEDGSDPTAATLKVRVRLQNPFLGNGCYIGSAQNPITIKLQTGTTQPPLPNLPISGNPGTYEFETTDPDNGYSVLHISGNTLVDNSFAVPAAKGCGNIALGLPIITQLLDTLVSGAVNLKVGLPSASGKNTAIMSGQSAIAGTPSVLSSVQ